MSVKIINIDIDGAYKLVKENIYSCKGESKSVTDTKFHHETNIKNVPDVLKNGLLSKRESVKLEGRELTEKEKFIYSDDYHVNGLDYISLSTVEDDFSKMYEWESLYDPFNTIDADIIISKDVKACRNTTNYYNEFLVNDRISTDLFRSIDLRILNILNFNFCNSEKNKSESRIKLMIEYYNFLKYIALALKENNLDIPLREVSNEIITLDIDKVIKLPQLQLKKY